MGRMSEFLTRLANEPPFRVVVRAVLAKCNVSVATRSIWELSKRPEYLLCTLTAAEEARREKVPEISIIEFGVAGGDGLLTLQREAEAVERETGVRIKVYGFDMGPQGLPSFIGDYRDHPDRWQPGDFPMDEAALRARLTDRTTLILGNVKDTVPRLFSNFNAPPIGFVSIDLDLYSSTRDALQIFTLPDKKMLWHVAVYLDDVEDFPYHRFAGEMLAVDEFNQTNHHVKIDQWRGAGFAGREDSHGIVRPFPERTYLKKLYVAHDLEGISKIALERKTWVLPIRE